MLVRTMPVRRCLLLVLAVLLVAVPLAAGAPAASDDRSGYELVDGGLFPPPVAAAPASVTRALVAGPAIAYVSPPIASAGTNTTITITGTGFGPSTPAADVGFVSASGVYWASGCTNTVNPNGILSWSDTAIVVRVPSGLGATGAREAASSGGLVVVTGTGQESAPFPFAVSFGVAGRRWAAPPVFSVNDNCPGVPGGADAVRRAVATWNTALPETFQIACSGTSNRTEAAKDGVSLIAWGPSGAIRYYYENDTIVEADIILSTSYAWTAGDAGGSVYGIEPVTLRDLAFCLGVAWLDGTEPQGPSDASKASCRYRADTLGNMNLVQLSPADRAAANYLYGSGDANPPLLAAAFTADPLAGPAPLAVQFHGTSLGGATGSAWDFGDGETSTRRDPAHTYAEPGNYTVALTASAPGYPDDTIRAVKRIGVTGPPVVAVPGGAGVPTSTAGDGLCDDVNGNGRRDFNDVVLYFNQLSWITGNEPIACFDCNGNGRVDFADVVLLFNNL
ncbi:MAG: PKD domain-containing protein [Methanospirillum sp.]